MFQYTTEANEQVVEHSIKTWWRDICISERQLFQHSMLWSSVYTFLTVCRCGICFVAVSWTCSYVSPGICWEYYLRHNSSHILHALSKWINYSTWNSNLNPYSTWNSNLSLVFNLEFQLQWGYIWEIVDWRWL